MNVRIDKQHVVKAHKRIANRLVLGKKFEMFVMVAVE